MQAERPDASAPPPRPTSGLPDKRVAYHSEAWVVLIEQGWTTWYVEDDGTAVMVKEDTQ